MKNMDQRIAKLSPLKKAYLALEDLQARLKAAESVHEEPLAVVGMGCRFPGGADSPGALWQLLKRGVDAVTEVPRERWDVDAYYDPDPETPGKTYARHGGFLKDVDLFDPWFFRLSPREALSMDPQQRLMLEVSWRALEHAGMAPDRLAGGKTGVFVGVTTNDYARLLADSEDLGIDGYYFTGNPMNTIAGRISYFYGFEGPSLAVDTACSSSLVSVHLACQSLRTRECDMALAGGVNLILTPENTIAVSKTRALAPDGRCKTFDAAANGFVRGEGCGVVVLKRLADALEQGDRPLALIRGSAVNQDGGGSGFTAPNAQAQRALLRQALGRLEPQSVDYVEAHGTGTALGDPIEMKALAAIYGQNRSPEDPLFVGSLKTNLGHMESAAGIGALIKTVLSLRNREIPAHLHFRDPSPHISWRELPVKVPTRLTPWPQTEGERRAGVSAFGASGTNAHVILAEPPSAEPVRADPDRTVHLLALSARSEPALIESIESFRSRLDANGSLNLGDLCFSANSGQAQFPLRRGIAASSLEELGKGLDRLKNRLSGDAKADAAPGPNQPPKIGFLFSGQASQYLGMGGVLVRTSPGFLSTLHRCDALLRPMLGASLIAALDPENEKAEDMRADLNDPLWAQTALYALECGLADLWRSWGVEPAFLLGHSIGEYAAAYTAGVFSLEDGLRLVAERARQMRELPERGEMAAIFAEDDLVREVVAKFEDELAIAAFNGPENTVISGARSAMLSALGMLSSAGVETRRLNVSHAFHSPLMAGIPERLEPLARQIEYAPPRVRLFSNITGELHEKGPDADYWCAQIRAPVRFAPAVKRLLEMGCEAIIEIGPKPVLSTICRRQFPDAAFPWLASLREGMDDWRMLATSLAAIYEAGARIDWRRWDRDYPRNRVTVPGYPFQRDRYWVSQGATSMNEPPSESLPAAQDPASEPGARQARVLETMRGALAELLRATPDAVSPHAPFLEMGADSIVLVEAIQTIETQFSLKLTMRQLFEELTTLDSLAVFISENMPPTCPWALENEAPSAPAGESTLMGQPGDLSLPELPSMEPGADAIERLLVEQNRILTEFMARQLEWLRGGGIQHRARPSSRVPASPEAGRPSTTAAPRASTEKTREKAPPPWGKAAEMRARGLTPRQGKHLEALIQRFNAKTPTSKRLARESRSYLADSRATVGFRFSTKEMLYPITGQRTNGSQLWDVDGNRYIDFSMGFGVHLLGHHPPFIDAAIEDEFKTSVELGARSPLVNEVAALIAEMTGLERVAFSNTGTEAVMAAMRLARAATGRDLIAIFTHSYHGHADGTLARDSGAGPDTPPLPMAPGVPAKVAESLLVLDYGEEQSLHILRERAGDLAAVMVEPVQSRNLTLQPKAFLQELRDITASSGSALIFDEMITGFRVHPGGAQAHFGVRADIATYGKIVGGGLPIGVVAGKAAFMDGIDGGNWSYGDASYPAAERTAFGGTFCQHPLVMATAAATLRHLKEQGPALQENLNQRTAQLAERLNTLFEEAGAPIKMTCFGSLFRFEFSSNLELLFYHLLEKGVYIWEWRSCFLSTAHSQEDVDFLVEAVRQTLAELREGGFFGDEEGHGAKGKNQTAPEKLEREAQRIPLSEAQQQLRLSAELERGGSIAYNISTSLELQGQMDGKAMRRALHELTTRHSGLRTTLDADGAHQLVHPRMEIDLEILDLSREQDKDAALEQWREEEGRTPFDLLNGPLFRAYLVLIAPHRQVLTLDASSQFVREIFLK